MFDVRRSSKSRRKAESKRHRLREGGQFEEEALVETLAEIVTCADRMREEIGSMLASLVQFGVSEGADCLQGQYEDLLLSVRQEMKTIWPQPGTQQAVKCEGEVRKYLVFS